MERYRKLELVQRSLGIRHKLKVHDSMKAPDTHEELALMLLARWELEDELHAIEEVLSEIRRANVQTRKEILTRAPQPGLVREPVKKSSAKSERVSG
jgi:hypothetical protein